MKNAKKAGFDAVKFQAFDKNITKNHPESNRLLKSSISKSNVNKIDKISREIGIEWFCTPMYPDAVNFLEPFVQRYKIRELDGRPLLENNSTSLIEKVLDTGKEVFVSSNHSPKHSKVVLTSSKGVIAKGQKLNFSPKNEDIIILGINSSLIYDKLNMQSDGLIEVNNINGKFNLNGKKSELKNDSIQIIGDAIKGEYKTINGINEVINLIVTDSNIANIITEKLNMFAIKATYFKDKNLIELFGNVKVIRDNEIILGDYAKINTLTQSYKVVSKDSTKVKILINKSDE